MCLFCKIISGELTSEKIAETEHSFAFLDIFPLNDKHILVMPKQHAEFFHELTEEQAADLAILTNRITKVLSDEYPAYNLIQNNGKLAHQAIPHVHIHIIPKTQERGLGLVWNSVSADSEALTAAGNDLRSKLGNSK
ncbi:hypothetical protein RCL1_005864 [Eukaryota sp. TZLM3-RCL]